MSRELSVAAKIYPGPIVWLAEITTPTQTHYFADDQVSFGGNTYLSYLRLTSGVRNLRGLQVNSAEIELIATDLYIAGLLGTEQFDGALCLLKCLLVGLEEAFVVLQGRITDVELGDEAASLRVISEPDWATITAQARNYEQACTWRFKSAQCGYAGAETSCNKTFAQCKDVMANQHRFNGFPTVTPPLTDIYTEPYPPVGDGGGDGGGGDGGDGDIGISVD